MNSPSSQNLCSNLEFDFSNPLNALRQLRGCRGVDTMKDEEELLQRFTTGWAHFAARQGVRSALRDLAHPEVRNALLPREDWTALVTHITGGTAFFSEITSSMNTLIVLQVITILSILLSVAMISIFMWRKVSSVPQNVAVQNLRRQSEPPNEKVGLLSEYHNNSSPEEGNCSYCR